MTEIVAAVVKTEPDLTPVPPRARPLLERCLQKDPKRRLRDIGDAMSLLDATGDVVSTASPTRSRFAWLTAAILLLIAIASVAALVVMMRRSAAIEPRTMRFSLALPDGWQLVTDDQVSGTPSPLVVSPDGRRVAMIAKRTDGTEAILLRTLDGLTATPLPDTGGASTMFWSPDSRFLAFFAQQTLKTIDVSGGAPTTVCAVQNRVSGGTWGADNTIVFSELEGRSTCSSESQLREAMFATLCLEGQLNRQNLETDQCFCQTDGISSIPPPTL